MLINYVSMVLNILLISYLSNQILAYSNPKITLCDGVKSREYAM